LKVYILMSADGAYICKKNGKVYISNTDLDKVNTYKSEKQAEKRIKDKRYWDYRNININSFVITPIELYFKLL
jgi:hypothetical protein